VANKRILCPEPRDLWGLWMWLHECGHIKLRHRAGGAEYWQEYRASRFAFEEIVRLGFALTAEFIQGVQDYVYGRLEKAGRRPTRTGGRGASLPWGITPASGVAPRFPRGCRSWKT
jgi:hypothetical protein